MSYNKLLAGMISYSLLACAICGCAANTTNQTTEQTAETENVSAADSITYLDADDMFTDRDKEVGYDEESATAITLSDDGSSCDASGVTVKENTITISEAGTYVLSGSLSNGQVIIDTDDEKVHLILDSVTINCDTSAALYVKSADKVFVTLAEGSENTLSNAKDFVAIDDNNIDAVIFSKDDLTLNGSGTLTIKAAYGHGIVSKDDLVITSGTYDITAAKHALAGKDSVRIANGTFTLTAGKDGIHSENTDNDEKGFIYIADGTINITCDSDGFDAEETLQVDGGTITVAAGDDGLHADGDLIIQAGTINITKSYEGLEGMTVTITDGDITVNSSDDGINAAGDGTSGTSSDETSSDTSSSGSDKKTPPEKPDGDDNNTPPQLPQNSSDSTEMPQPPQNSSDSTEMPQPPQNSSDSTEMPQPPQNSSDSGNMPQPDGNGGPGGGNGGPGGGGMEEATDYNLIQIQGGTLYINAEGDGIDSNGDLTISGGEIYVDGPVSGGDGALDCSGTATISGGTVIAVGSSGMVENFSDSSSQESMLVTVSSSMITGDITLTDSDGNTIVSYSPAKSYNSVVISCKDLEKDKTYTLTTGDIQTELTLDLLVKSVTNSSTSSSSAT